MNDSTATTPTVKELCNFLSHYASRLFACGANCIRLKKNVYRIAEAYDTHVELCILPRHLHLTVTDSSGDEICTSIVSIENCAASFATNASLSRLSWEIADHRINFHQALGKYQEIIGRPPLNHWTVATLAAFANASFCRLFGGDPIAMGIVLCSTFLGFIIKQLLIKRNVDVRIVVTFCSFISCIIAAMCSRYDLGATPMVAISTSVLYLVPGIPFINSFCDMIDRHYICAFGRLMGAVVITGCMSVGFTAGMIIMKVPLF